jgi:hypothetical protein
MCIHFTSSILLKISLVKKLEANIQALINMSQMLASNLLLLLIHASSKIGGGGG